MYHIMMMFGHVCSLPTDIQAEVVPLILGGGDVLAAAETGSGKTGAFSLPVVQIVHERLRSSPNTSNKRENRSIESCVLSLQHRSSIVAVSEDGLQCQARSDKEWGGCRATGSIKSRGKAYFEIIVEDEGLCRVGWSSQNSSLDIGTDSESFGYGGTGKKSHNRKFEDYGETFGLNDVIGCWIDMDDKCIGFTKNGISLGKAFDIPKKLYETSFFPAVTLKNAQVQFNFEDSRYPKCFPKDCFPFASNCELIQESDQTDASRKLPVALVLEPVRDLAQQTKDVMEMFASKLTSPPVPVSLVIGGESTAAQLKEIEAGAAIIVGTPGRIFDLVKQDKLDVSGVKFFVLDEADALLDAGHRDAILSLFRRLGASGSGVDRLQVLLFSATLHSPIVRKLSNDLCQNAAFVDLKGMNALPDAVDHVLVMIDPQEDRTWLQSTPTVWTDRIHDIDPPLEPTSRSSEAWSHASKILKPRILQRILESLHVDQALIFCRTNFDCENLERFLNELDKTFGGVVESPEKGDKRKRCTKYSCAVLAGAKSMGERRAALDAFKDRGVKYLIATDVAARGIDVSGLPYVINMTLPDKCEDYVHRSGRVGRAENPGLCISLVSTVSEKVWFCRKKGLKPWLNPTKENASGKKGGHAIWIQEKLLLREIEERLGAPMVHLQSDMTLPPSLSGSMYGKGKNTSKEEPDLIALEVAARVEASRESVKNLAKLEHEAQKTFFKLQSMW